MHLTDEYTPKKLREIAVAYVKSKWSDFQSFIEMDTLEVVTASF